MYLPRKKTKTNCKIQCKVVRKGGNQKQKGPDMRQCVSVTVFLHDQIAEDKLYRQHRQSEPPGDVTAFAHTEGTREVPTPLPPIAHITLRRVGIGNEGQIYCSLEC